MKRGIICREGESLERGKYSEKTLKRPKGVPNLNFYIDMISCYEQYFYIG